MRSRVELVSVLEGRDLTHFDYKSGKFYHSENPFLRVRNRKVLLGHSKHKSIEDSYGFTYSLLSSLSHPIEEDA